tara:strand:+ start:556 stop:1089 length:534 start_codon:yes stop_codon:yes gene_type:complete
MNEFTKLLIASSLAGVLLIAGCEIESTPESSAAQSEGVGHDHSGHNHAEDHNETGHGEHDHADDHEDGNHDEHGAERFLGSVAVAGSTLSVSAGGEIRPNATLHIEIEHTAGRIPAAIRLWIGTESGENSLKSKASRISGKYIAKAEVPAELTPEYAFWIEIETSDGERLLSSIALN